MIKNVGFTTKAKSKKNQQNKFNILLTYVHMYVSIHMECHETN